MESIEFAVANEGIGLVMIGGEHSFGAGDWRDTPVEKALPVEMDIKQETTVPDGAHKAGGPIGHTRWCNGGVYYSGFTTAMPPNPPVTAVSRAVGFANAGRNAPMDWDSVDENDGGPTYMSLAASSYHPGGVNTLFADGSVRFVKNSVSAVTWRALGSIAGGEVVSADGY